MSSQPLIVRTCRHIFPDGRHCQGAAVRGRSCCRHHLMARTRLHKMARARRLSVIPRFYVARSPRDLALNQAELSRVLATERIDPDVARLMLWAQDLSAAALHAESASAPSRIRSRDAKPNEIYQVPINNLFARSCMQIPAESIENTVGRGEGYNVGTDRAHP